jgi:replication factor C subunit 1
VVGQPSSKTSYVVLGDNAGTSKVAAIKKHGLKSLNEDEFLNLIATRVVKEKDLDANTRKKMEKEQAAIRQAAQEMEKREKGKGKQGRRWIVCSARETMLTVTLSSSDTVGASSQLWTSRYAPQTLKEICGNKGQVEKLQQWLHDWSVKRVRPRLLADGDAISGLRVSRPGSKNPGSTA